MLCVDLLGNSSMMGLQQRYITSEHTDSHAGRHTITYTSHQPELTIQPVAAAEG